MAKLQEVFGVSKEPIRSYIERSAVDDRFKAALAEQKHIIVYGASKQGKTALLNRHTSETNRVVVHCAPESTLLDLYRSLLRQLGIAIQREVETSLSGGAELGGKGKVGAWLAVFARADARPDAFSLARI